MTAPGSPIPATIESPLNISIASYDDGVISIPAYTTKTLPAVVDLCRYILKSCGKPARPYKVIISAGAKSVFIIPTVYFGSRLTITQDYSDIEVVRGNSFTGQIL